MAAAAEVVEDDATRCEPLRDYRPHPRQRVMHALRTRLKKRFRAVKAGRRGGKTQGAAADVVDSVARDLVDRRAGTGRFADRGPSEFKGWIGSDPEPLLHYWVVAPTYDLLGEPKKYLQRYWGLAQNGGLIVDQDRSQGIYRLEGGIRVDFRSAQKPELLVSRGLHGVWGDEAARWRSDVWTEAVLPTLADQVGWALLTTTPLGRNWFWRDVWRLADPVEAAIARDEGHDGRLDPDYGAAEWYTRHNTALPHLAREVERARGRMPPALWRRSFEASFSAFVGQVFDLERSRHLRANTSWLRTSFDLGIVAGYDHGWNHPGVVTVWGARSAAPRFVELETVARRRTVVSGDDDSWTAIAKRLRKRWGFREIYVPTDAREAAAQFRRAGLQVRQAFQDRLAGLQWFQCAHHTGDVVYSSPHVYARIESLHHPEGHGRESELWVKEDDDEFDANRYALTHWIRRGKLPGEGRIRLVESVLGR